MQSPFEVWAVDFPPARLLSIKSTSPAKWSLTLQKGESLKCDLHLVFRHEHLVVKHPMGDTNEGIAPVTQRGTFAKSDRSNCGVVRKDG